MNRKDQARRRKRRQKLAKAKRHAQTTAKVAPSNQRRSSSRSTGRLRENRRFNRLESELDHFYYPDYGTAGSGPCAYDGWIKCRLLHGLGYSLIIPDQIYLEHQGLRWIQPLAFGPNVLGKLSDTEVVCDRGIDISCGHRIGVRFFNRDHVMDLPDGSQLFKCRLQGPNELHDFCTGEAEWNANGQPYVRLFHHTSSAIAPLIRQSSHFRTGPYNIQGSWKQLKNVAYAYFTPLDSIQNDNDLKKIAMSAGGTIELRRDGFMPPPSVGPDFLKKYKDDILQLQVYRSDPAKREASIDVWIDASILAPQHIYRHDEGLAVYYELPHHFIHRVGSEPGRNVAFDAAQRIHRQAGLKSFDYIVVGDCTTLDGLAAPYDEEDTTHIMKVERMTPGTTILDFWFAHGNTDHFTGKAVAMQEFETPSPSGSSGI